MNAGVSLFREFLKKHIFLFQLAKAPYRSDRSIHIGIATDFKKTLLVIAPFPTLKNADHAGGKTHCHYMQKLEKDYEITFICNFSEEERKSNWQERKLDGEYRIVSTQNYYKPTFIEKCINKIIHILHINKLSYYAFFIDYYKKRNYIAEMKKLKASGYNPAVVVLDWTQCIFFSKSVRKIFPDAKLIGVEQDVTFLNFERRIMLAKTKQERKKARKQYEIIKKSEIRFLSYVDTIDVFNRKDANLLTQNGVSLFKIRVISPYFDNYSMIRRSPNMSSIIFYGQMNRPENYECCIWFIENVFNRLPDNFTFTIIGSKPHESLLSYASERIRITGFVENVEPYFETALCSLVPLLLGAGIKVKVLESMSAGVPVLTNNIGIEGIPAKDGLEYLHCETADDYISAITKLAGDEKLRNLLSENGRKFIKETFDYERDSYI